MKDSNKGKGNSQTKSKRMLVYIDMTKTYAQEYIKKPLNNNREINLRWLISIRILKRQLF